MVGIKLKKKSPKPRAKMFLRAKLGWLWGYPLTIQNQSIQWQQLYYPMPWDTALLSAEVKNDDRLQRKAKALIGLHPDLRTIIEGFVWWLSIDNKTLVLALE